MDNFEYEYHPDEPHKSGGRTFILILVIILLLATAFLIGALSKDYFDIFPNNDHDTEIKDATTQEIVTPTAVPLAPQPTDAVNTIELYNDIPYIVEQVSGGVVSITSYYSSTSSRIEDWEPMAYGTGVIITTDGFIVTNNHVIADAGKITVTLHDGEKLVAELIGNDRYVDLAVLKIQKSDLYSIPFGDSTLSKPGEQVIAIGSPLGDELTGTVTSGIISAVDRQLEVDGIPFTLLQTDAAVNPGNSGGPLVNMKGELIGINTLKSIFAGYDEYGTVIAAEGISYAIPSNSVQDAIDDIMTYGGIVRPFIGVFGNDVSVVTGIEGQPLPDGFVIADTVENSPAQISGMLADDIIIAIDGEKITGFTDLYTIINSYSIGDILTFTIYRPSTNEEIDLDLTLASNQDFK